MSAEMMAAEDDADAARKQADRFVIDGQDTAAVAAAAIAIACELRAINVHLDHLRIVTTSDE